MGPVGLAAGPEALLLIADALAPARNLCGRGQPGRGFHLRGVVPGEHFSAQFADIHVAMPGDFCPTCNSPLKVEKTIEIGNIFRLGNEILPSPEGSLPGSSGAGEAGRHGKLWHRARPHHRRSGGAEL